MGQQKFVEILAMELRPHVSHQTLLNDTVHEIETVYESTAKY